jgi:hypothetical protein
MNETTKESGDAFLTAKPRLNEMNEEYLTIKEVAVRLKVKPKTIQNKMAKGILTRGVHYFSPKGLGPRFKWSAVVAWLEGKTTEERLREEIDEIPMAKGYMLGKPRAVRTSSVPLDGPRNIGV